MDVFTPRAWKCKFLTELEDLQDAPQAEQKGETTFLAGNTSCIFPAFTKVVFRGFSCYCQSPKHPKNGAVFVSLSGSLPICSGSPSPQQALNKNDPISSPANRVPMTNSGFTHRHSIVPTLPPQKWRCTDVPLPQPQMQSRERSGTQRELEFLT